MAWLGTWEKRIEITVDHTKIDSDLAHFPVPIPINSAAGQSNDDLTCIFDEVGANSQKIAVTKSDGTTQIYVEIEKWDNVGEDALLWASKSDFTATSASSAKLYIYYDNSQDDNTTYIGTLGNRSEVWDANYESVYLMADASGGLTDSTGNGNDLAENGNPTYQQAGQLGYAITFDGNDYFYKASVFNFSGQVDWTILVRTLLDDSNSDQYIITTNTNTGLYIRVDDSPGPASFWKIDDGTDDDYGPGTTNPYDGNWYTWHQVLDDGNSGHYGYINGVKEHNGVNTSIGDLADTFYLGARDTGTAGAQGEISHVRVSSTDRSAAWMKAEHSGFVDDLLEFGGEEVRINIPAASLVVTGYAPTISATDHYRIEAELSAGVWTDIAGYVIGDIRGYWGMMDEKPTTLIADSGILKMVLKNDDSKFVPGVSGALSGWDKGTPIKIEFQVDAVQYVRFYGTIVDLDPFPGKFGNNRVRVEVGDWLEFAAIHPLLSPAIASDKRSDEMVTTIVADMPIAPLNTDYETGEYTFDTAFDTLKEKTTAYAEMAKVALSEFAPIYLQKDQVDGETLVVENAHTRNGLRTVDFTLDNSMYDIELAYGDNVVNWVKSEAYPRSVAGSASVLFETETRILVPAASELDNIRGNYTDPNGGAAAVGANMIAPVVTTDYTMNTKKNGSGSNITADLTVTTSYGASGVTYKFENANANPGWVWIRARGYLVNQYNTVSAIKENSDSQDEYGYNPLSFKQKYQQEIRPGEMKAEAILEQEREPRLVPKSVTFVANRSADLWEAFLEGDVGKVARIKNSVYDVDALCYIQGVQFIIRPGGVIMCKWILQVFLSLALGLSACKCEFDLGSTDIVDFGYIPAISGDGVNKRTVSVWINPDSVVSETPDGYNDVVADFSAGVGIDLALTDQGAGDLVVLYVDRFDTAYGSWTTPAGSISLSSNQHILYTIDLDDPTNTVEIWIDGVKQTLTTAQAPVGAVISSKGVPLTIGNSYYEDVSISALDSAFDGKIWNARVYDDILTDAEKTSLAADGDVTRSMVFQAPCIQTRDLDYYEDHTLAATDKIIDNMYWAIGTPGGSVITRLIP